MRYRNIDLRVVLLLAIYIFSINPNLPFHHHEHHIVAFNKASTCEKAIFYGKGEEACHHKAHISKVLKKCSLCDHHTVSVHSIPSSHLILAKTIFSSREYFISKAICSNPCECSSGRGPPAV